MITGPDCVFDPPVLTGEPVAAGPCWPTPPPILSRMPPPSGPRGTRTCSAGLPGDCDVSCVGRGPRLGRLGRGDREGPSVMERTPRGGCIPSLSCPGLLLSPLTAAHALN